MHRPRAYSIVILVSFTLILNSKQTVCNSLQYLANVAIKQDYLVLGKLQCHVTWRFPADK